MPCASSRVSSGSGLRPGPESNLNGNPGRVGTFPTPEAPAPAWPAAGPAGFCSWNPALETLESPNAMARCCCVAGQQSITTSRGWGRRLGAPYSPLQTCLPDPPGNPLHSSQAGGQSGSTCLPVGALLRGRPLLSAPMAWPPCVLRGPERCPLMSCLQIRGRGSQGWLLLAGVPSRSVVSDSVTPWTVARQAPLYMGFSRQEYWNGLPCPPPGDLPNPGIESRSSALQADSLLSERPEKLTPSRAISQTSISKSRLQGSPPPLCIPHQSPSNPRSFAHVATPVFSRHLRQPEPRPGHVFSADIDLPHVSAAPLRKHTDLPSHFCSPAGALALACVIHVVIFLLGDIFFSGKSSGLCLETESILKSQSRALGLGCCLYHLTPCWWAVVSHHGHLAEWSPLSLSPHSTLSVWMEGKT